MEVVTLWSLERWVADWSLPNNSGGPRRNRAMATGDPRLALRVDGIAGEKSRSMISRGPIGALVHWPGGTGTAGMVKEAEAVRARVVSIGELR